MQFKIKLGNARPVKNNIRSEKDRTYEVLVDYTDPSVEGESLGWLTCLHDFGVKDSHDVNPLTWYLMGPSGDPLPGIPGNYDTQEDAIRAAESWMKAFIERGRMAGLRRDLLSGEVKL